MAKTRTDKEVNNRCEFLESLGFQCEHQDIYVTHPALGEAFIDFSTVKMDVKSVLSHTIRKVFEEGYVCGENHLQAKLRGLLGLEE